MDIMGVASRASAKYELTRGESYMALVRALEVVARGEIENERIRGKVAARNRTLAHDGEGEGDSTP